MRNRDRLGWGERSFQQCMLESEKAEIPSECQGELPWGKGILTDHGNWNRPFLASGGQGGSVYRNPRREERSALENVWGIVIGYGILIFPCFSVNFPFWYFLFLSFLDYQVWNTVSLKLATPVKQPLSNAHTGCCSTEGFLLRRSLFGLIYLVH